MPGAPSELLKVKILLAVAGQEDGGTPGSGGEEPSVLASKVVERFEVARRKQGSREEAAGAIEALVGEGALEEVARARGARGLRLTGTGRARCLALRFDGRGVIAARFSGKQVDEALRPLRAEIARLRSALAEAALEGAPLRSANRGDASGDAGGRGGGPAPGKQAAARARHAPDPAALEAQALAVLADLERAERPAGGLVPVFRLREALDGVPAEAVDDALWSLARRRAVSLLKKNDEAEISEAERLASFFHPVTGGLLYYARREEPAPAAAEASS